jgi:hypothetical protein
MPTSSGWWLAIRVPSRDPCSSLECPASEVRCTISLVCSASSSSLIGHKRYDVAASSLSISRNSIAAYHQSTCANPKRLCDHAIVDGLNREAIAGGGMNWVGSTCPGMAQKPCSPSMPALCSWMQRFPTQIPGDSSRGETRRPDRIRPDWLSFPMLVTTTVVA